MPEISVIIPVYKAEKFLRKCLDSVVAQTLTDFELILVDDGSPDRCGAICDEYAGKDGRVVVIHKENGGVGSARNAGLGRASGRFIAFIDSDDYVDENYLEILSDMGAEMNVCSLTVEDAEKEKKLGTETFPYFSSDKLDVTEVKTLLENRALNYVHSKLLNRDIIERYCIRFKPELVLSEDTLFICEFVAKASSVKVTDKPMYHYSKGISDSLSSDFGKRQLLCAVEANYSAAEVLSASYGEEFYDIFDKRLNKLFILSFERVISSNRSVGERYRKFKTLYSMTYFRNMVRNKDVCFGGYSRKKRFVIGLRSSLILTVISYLLYR